MPELPLVIVNPASAGGRTRNDWPSIASDLATHFGAFNCAFTQGRGDGMRLAEDEARRGRAVIIACSCDGTISEVANGILRASGKAELGVLPSGTGGDFRRTLRLSGSAAEAARELRTGATRLMDAGRVTYRNFEGADETRYFVNVASCGMGGEVIRRVKGESSSLLPAGAARLLGGGLSFAAAALETTFSFSPPLLRLQIDEQAETRLRINNLCIANAQYFGGGMRVAPTARLDDGLLDIVAIGDLSALGILANSYRIYFGTHLGIEKVRHTRARRIRVLPAEAHRQVLIEVDGELAGHLPATFELLPAALRIRTVKS